MTIFSGLVPSQLADRAISRAAVDGGVAPPAADSMTAAFAAYETQAVQGGPALMAYTEPVSTRRRRQACSSPNWLVGAVKSVIRYSTAGASDVVMAANREIVTATLDPSASKFADADCAAAPSMSECQRQPESEAFSRGTAEDLQRWQSRMDRLDGLISFRGKYAGLAIIQRLQKKWCAGEPAASAQAAYQDWRRTDSYASFMDAVVAELKESGDYGRLVQQRLAIARRSPKYERDIRSAMRLNPGKDRRWVEAAMRNSLADWERFKGDTRESGVLGRKRVLWELLDGERTATGA